MHNLYNKPFFSIITPVYNNQRYLEECLSSVENQTYRSYEHIIIDNNNDPMHEEYIKNCLINTTQTLYLQENTKGVSAARNNGMQNSVGEYILFLDSDDYYSNPQFLEQLSEEIKNLDPSFAWIGYLQNLQKFKIIENNLILSEDTITTGRSKHPNLIKELVHISIPEPALIIPKKYLLDSLFDIDQKTAEGYSLIIDIASKLEKPESIKYIKLKTLGYMYRDHEYSTTKQNNWDQIELVELNKIYTKILQNPKFSPHFRHIASVTKLRLNSRPKIGRVIFWYAKLLTNWKF